jgi:holo-[acyl-carrier protein] synthase
VIAVVIGIGVDICQIARLARLRQRYGARFLDRVFTPAEQEHCGTGAACDERFAARFAAKEAFLKALGTGFAQGMSLRDVEIVSEPSGRPVLRITGAAARLLQQRGGTGVHVSLSHEREYALAFVVLEG